MKRLIAKPLHISSPKTALRKGGGGEGGSKSDLEQRAYIPNTNKTVEVTSQYNCVVNPKQYLDRQRKC